MRQNPRPKKSLGQHFLTSQRLCRRIVRLAVVDRDETVVEIGPGTGQLTRALLAAGARVVAIEFDRDMIGLLAPLVEQYPGRLTLLQNDVLQVDWEDLLPDSRLKVLGNLPYNISTRLLRKMSRHEDRFHSLTVMVQAEVADRILARPGQPAYGFLTVVLAMRFAPENGFRVPPGAFAPPPRVDSRVLRLFPRCLPWSVAEYTAVEAVAARAFASRRKTLFNNLRSGAGDRETAEKALKSCRIEPGIRPQQVSLEQFACLAKLL